jgi:hypothetical protein
VIEAEWFGGPHDGVVLALSGKAAFPVETVMEPPPWDEGFAVSFHVKWVQPEYVRGRWLLIWKE